MLPTNSKKLRVRNINGIVSTDDILPAHYKHKFTDPSDMAPHVFENKLPGFSSTLKANDVIVCNSTFGIGSSREQAVSALLAAGVSAVIAPAFGRIFFRNAWNLGLIAVSASLPGIPEFSDLLIALEQGEIITSSIRYQFVPIPVEIINILQCGGLLNYVKNTATNF